MRRLALLLTALSAALSHGQLKPPPPENDDIKKHDMAKRAPTPADVRLKGYQTRLEMEARSPYSKLEWRSAGPVAQGGRVINFSTPANVPDKFYVAYATGGLWRSEDMGNRWKPLCDPIPGVAIGDFALSKDGKTIWIGTGENNSQRTSYDGMGMFKSTDEGKTWSYAGLAETQRIGRVLINPKNENTVYVGAIGGLYSTSPDRGVYKTTDGGKSWSQVLKLDNYTGVIDMVMDPRNPDVLYAAAWDRERRAWNIKDGGPGTAIYKTTDGGKTWNKVMSGFPDNQSLGRIGLALAPSKPDRVYAYIDNRGGDLDDLYRDDFTPAGILNAKRFRLIKDPAVFTAIDPKVLATFVANFMPTGTKADEVIQAVKDKKMTLDDIAKKMEERNPAIWQMPVAETEIYRTDDAGKSWQKVNLQYLDTSGYGYYCGRITVNPKNADEIVVMNMALYRSRDGGKSFETFGNSMHSDHHAYWYDANNPKFQASGNDGGIYWSFDGGEFWRQITQDMSVGQFTTLALDNKTPYNIYGGLQDNGTLKGPNTHNPSTSPASQWTRLGGGDGSAVVTDPRPESEVVYGSSQFGSFYGVDQKTNTRWSFGGRPSFAEATGLRWNWISPIVVSKHKPDTIYIGSNRVHRSDDQGKKWVTISVDLTTNKPNGDVPFSTVKELSESPAVYGTLYAGTDDGRVWITKDDGKTWENISTPVDKWVCRIVASRHDPATVYVAQTGYREDDYAPYLWKSTDYGKTWKSIVGNLPPEMLNTVREDPTNKDWLYVGTDLGVFISRDNGTNWIPLAGALPRTPVHDVQVHERDKDLVLASHARGVWVLQLEKIYELTDAIMSKDFHLWPVQDMTRGNWEYRRVFQPDPEAEEETSPGAPPQGRRGGFQAGGTSVRGELWTKTGGNGSIRLKDKSGKVVKEQAMIWATGYNPWAIDLLLKEANRFKVDPRKREIKSADDALKDPFESERPVYVPAGEYTIEFVIGGKTETVNWKLNPG